MNRNFIGGIRLELNERLLRCILSVLVNLFRLATLIVDHNQLGFVRVELQELLWSLIRTGLTKVLSILELLIRITEISFYHEMR